MGCDIFGELKEFIRFAVAEDDYERAVRFVEDFKEHPQVVSLLHRHYAQLPDADEQPVTHVDLLRLHQGVGLYVVTTERKSYVYLVSLDEIVWLGCDEDELPAEVLQFFSARSLKELLEQHLSKRKGEKRDGEKQQERLHEVLCPACGVEEGEVHLLGCVVELCPWCDGQLNQCDCRFTMLEVDEISSEEELDRLEALLEAKGRIPFEQSQLPSYPGTSKGLDV